MPEDPVSTEFRPTIVLKKGPTTPEKRNVPETRVLGELAKDQEKVTAFRFILQRVGNRDYGDLASFQARLNVTGFRPDGYAVVNNTAVRSPNGIFIYEPFAEDRVVVNDDEQRKFGTKLFLERSETGSDVVAADPVLPALNNIVSRVISGDFQDEASFQARLNVTGFRPDGYAVVNNTVLRGPNGNFIYEPFAEERAVVTDSEQKTLLQVLLVDTIKIKNEKIKAQRISTGLKAFAPRVFSGDFQDEASFQARLNINSFRDTGYAYDNNNTAVKSPNGAFIYEPFAEDRVIIDDERTKEVLSDLYKTYKSPAVPSEAKELLRSYVETNDTKVYERLTLVMTSADKATTDNLLSVVNRYKDLRRQSDLKSVFYDKLQIDDSLDNPLKVLSDYETDGVEDQRLVAELREQINVVQRIQVTRDFVSSAQNHEDFDRNLLKLNTLEKSRNEKDRAFGLTLRKAAYRKELAFYRNQINERLGFNIDKSELFRYIEQLPVRPAAGDIDFLGEISKYKETALELAVDIQAAARLNAANAVRESFGTLTPESVFEEIDSFPGETEEEMKVKSELLELYKNYLVVKDPAEFDRRFAKEIQKRQAAALKEQFTGSERGSNLEAFRYLRGNFLSNIAPLVEALRQDPRTETAMKAILGEKEGQFSGSKLQYIQKLRLLEAQRPLTDNERTYLRSTELLTAYNPYLVAILNANGGVVAEYLKHHFEAMSSEKKKGLQDGVYVPAILVGTGPNGVAALGELVRDNPNLASNTLVVDSGEQVGGPFAIPGGPAWELNSANRRGERGYFMPKNPNGEELKSVRAYGSPIRWYPGERVPGSDVRPGSINATVDYLPTPDDISTQRYPTNEELQHILALQTAILTKNISLKTDVMKVVPNPNKSEKGDKIVTLRITETDGRERIITVKTDALIMSTGLGEPTYGFELKGSKAEKVIQQTQGSNKFAKISTTLEAFKQLSDRSTEKATPGRVVVIWGRGNSADTIIENIGRIFQNSNPLVSDVTKIYVVSDGDLSERPRYGKIRDLKSRNGRGNLVEFVKTRVADADFATNEGNPEDRKIVVLDVNGKIINDSTGRPIVADSGIAATGFKPNLEKVFEAYLEPGQTFRGEGSASAVEALTLPTNPDVAVADVLRKDKNVVFIGTSSNPRFTQSKLRQLPPESADALARNGAENAVAIGFRAPDSQAAVNIWQGSREFNLEPKPDVVLPKIPITGENGTGSKFAMERGMVDTSNLNIPNFADDIDQGELILSPILSYNLSNSFSLDTDFNGEFKFELVVNPTTKEIEVKFKEGTIDKISSEFIGGVLIAVQDTDFQRYAINLLQKRRRDPKLNLNIAFKQGKINSKETFVQAI